VSVNAHATSHLNEQLSTGVTRRAQRNAWRGVGGRSTAAKGISDAGANKTGRRWRRRRKGDKRAPGDALVISATSQISPPINARLAAYHSSPTIPGHSSGAYAANHLIMGGLIRDVTKRRCQHSGKGRNVNISSPPALERLSAEPHSPSDCSLTTTAVMRDGDGSGNYCGEPLLLPSPPAATSLNNACCTQTVTRTRQERRTFRPPSPLTRENTQHVAARTYAIAFSYLILPSQTANLNVPAALPASNSPRLALSTGRHAQ